ncbi:type II toxin-antitoxin system YoeB family toxin, partial [Flavobacterium psychrophilum]
YSEETFSRRINREHRIVYRINENTVTVFVLSAYGHY